MAQLPDPPSSLLWGPRVHHQPRPGRALRVPRAPLAGRGPPGPAARFPAKCPVFRPAGGRAPRARHLTADRDRHWDRGTGTGTRVLDTGTRTRICPLGSVHWHRDPGIGHRCQDPGTGTWHRPRDPDSVLGALAPGTVPGIPRAPQLERSPRIPTCTTGPPHPFTPPVPTCPQSPFEPMPPGM